METIRDPDVGAFGQNDPLALGADRQLSAWLSTFVNASKLRPQDSNLDLTAPKAVVLPLHQGGPRDENAR